MTEMSQFTEKQEHLSYQCAGQAGDIRKDGGERAALGMQETPERGSVGTETLSPSAPCTHWWPLWPGTCTLIDWA